MPIHDWTRVDAGIFHALHHGWITEIARRLNRDLLPAEYYALPEQHAAGFGPDVLALERNRNGAEDESMPERPTSGGISLAAPKLEPTAETEVTLAAYECGLTVRAYVVHAAIGDTLPEMPLFLEPGQSVHVPVEATYMAAFADMPQRWRRVMEATGT